MHASRETKHLEKQYTAGTRSFARWLAEDGIVDDKSTNWHCKTYRLEVTKRLERNSNYSSTASPTRHFQSYLQRTSQQTPAYLVLGNVTGICRIVFSKVIIQRFNDRRDSWFVIHTFIHLCSHGFHGSCLTMSQRREETHVEAAALVHYLFART